MCVVLTSNARSSDSSGEAPWPVALQRHPQPVGPGKAHGGGHLHGTGGEGDRGRARVGEECPGLAGLVVALVARGDHRLGEPRAQGGEVD